MNPVSSARNLKGSLMNNATTLPDPGDAAYERPGRRHVRAACVAAGALTVVVASAGAASARSLDWAPWTPPAPTIDIACGSTPVHLSWPVNKEYMRTQKTLPDGSSVTQFTGSLTVHLATDDGRSLTVSAGGPTQERDNLGGTFDYEVHSEGHYVWSITPELAAELGVPQVFASEGLIDFVVHQSALNEITSITPVRVPANVQDLCAELGVH
jgi:hypothetical protein